MTASVGARKDLTLTSEEEVEFQKYDVGGFCDNGIEYQETIFETKPGTSIKSSSLPDLSELRSQVSTTHIQEEHILSSVEGVIDRIDGKTVRVKLFPKSYANFPRILFTNKKKIRQGQHIKYMIKKDKDGYRYQEIVPIENTKQHPEKEEILKLLDELKYRNE